MGVDKWFIPKGVPSEPVDTCRRRRDGRSRRGPGRDAQYEIRTTMERRKFVVGMGSLAAGGAAAMGSGAFTSVRADRALNASTAGDASAYLAIHSGLSPHAEQTGNTVEIQFDGSGGVAGEGLNDNADTFFSDVLRIENRGDDIVRLEVGDDSIGTLPDGPMVVSYTDESNDGNGAVTTTPFASSPSPSYWSNSGNKNNQDLAPGQDLYVHFGFYLNEDTDALGENTSTDVSDVPDSINFYADDTSTGSTGDFN